MNGKGYIKRTRNRPLAEPESERNRALILNTEKRTGQRAAQKIPGNNRPGRGQGSGV